MARSPCLDVFACNFCQDEFRKKSVGGLIILTDMLEGSQQSLDLSWWFDLCGVQDEDLQKSLRASRMLSVPLFEASSSSVYSKV